jgi:integrase
MPLTQHSVDAAKPRDKDYELRDDEGRNHVKGLFLRVRPGGSRTYYVQIARGTKVKIGSAGAVTLTAARQAARTEIGKAMSGYDHKAENTKKRKAKQQTLGTYLDGDFGEHAEANIASHKDFLRSVKKGFPHLLKKPMQEINDGLDMARWRKNRQGVSVETLRRELTYLKAVLNHAVKAKVIDGHQLGGYTVTAQLGDKQNATKLRYLTEAEERALRKALKDRDKEIRQKRASANEWRKARGYDLKPALTGYADYLEPLVLFALNTGLRRGDLLNLKWENIDLTRKQMTLVIGKTSHVRRKRGKPVEPVTLPLSKEAAEILTKLQKQAPSEHVFTGPTGARLGEVKKSFENLMTRAGIKDFRFHDLRHTFASKLAMAGVDINTIRELMTHSDIKMTLVYAHLSPDHKAAALERAFGGAS